MDFSELIEARQPVAELNCNPCEKPTLYLLVALNDNIDALAAISPIFVNYGDSNYREKIYSTVWQTLNTGQDPLCSPVLQAEPLSYPQSAQSLYHGSILINPDFDWHLDLNSTPPTGSIDFYTVMLHEFYHLFGMTSNIDNTTGVSLIQPTLGDLFFKYSDYDTHLHFVDASGNIQPVINVIPEFGCGPFSGETFYNPPASLVIGEAGAVCGDLLYISDHFPQAIPVNNEVGFSNIYNAISHFDDSCWGVTGFAPTFLAPNYAGVNRSIEAFEAMLLCDWDYQTTGNFGSPTSVIGTDYSDAHHISNDPDYACGETRVIAADDNCDSLYEVSDCEGINIPVEDLLANDENVDFVYTESIRLEVGNPNQIDIEVDVNGNVSSINVNTAGYAGYLIISYVGGSDEGSGCHDSNRANIYIYAPACEGLNCVSTEDCNLICNPGFDFIVQGSGTFFGDFYHSVNVESPGWATAVGDPDYYTEFTSTAADSNNPCSIESAVRCRASDEGLFTILQEPLENGKRYILSSEFLWTDDPVPAPGTLGNVQLNFNFHSSEYLMENCLSYPLCHWEVLASSPLSVAYELEVATGECFKTARCITTDELDASILLDGLYVLTGISSASMLLDRLDLLEDQLYGLEDESYSCVKDPIKIGPDLTCNDYFKYQWHSSTDGGQTWSAAPIATGTPLTVNPTNEVIVYRLTQVLNSDKQLIAVDPCIEEEAVYYSVDNNEFMCCLADAEYMLQEDKVFSSSNDILSLGANPITVNADLIIAEGSQIYLNNLDFEFGPEGRIVVQRKAEVTVRNCSFSGTCKTMWPGIIVEGSGLEAQDGAVFMISDSRISDAIVGISSCNFELEDHPSLAGLSNAVNRDDFIDILLDDLDSADAVASSGGQIDTYSNNAFTNCLVSINASHGFSMASVFGSKLEIDGGLRFPLTSCRHHAGVYSDEVESLRVTRSQFQNLDFGVQANDTRFLTVSNSMFNHNFHGIWTDSDVELIPNTRITRNQLEDCENAIWCRDDLVSITENKINSDQVPNGASGIRIQDCAAGTSISRNTIGYVDHGIELISNNFIGDIRVNNNLVFRIGRAIFSLGQNPQVLISCNLLASFGSGIQIEDFTDPNGNVEAGFLSPQGDCAGSVAASNLFWSGGVSIDIWNGAAATFDYWDNGAISTSGPVNTACFNTLNNQNCGPIGTSWKQSQELALDLDDEVLVYPNPAQERVHFESRSLDQRAAGLQIYNSDGKLMGDWVMEQSTTIDVSSWPNGGYFYQILRADGSSDRAQFMVVR